MESLAGVSVLPVEVADLPQRRLPDVIEASLYFLVAEAMTNANKYARSTRLVVSIHQQGPVVICELSDDGVGGADTASGSGLSGLADRLTALGGTLKVTSPPGEGTRLHATLPIGGARTAREPFLLFGHRGDDGEGAERIAAILAGRKRVSIQIAREWELEGGLPRIGQHLPADRLRGHPPWRRRGGARQRDAVPRGRRDGHRRGAHRVPVTIEQWREEVRAFYALRRDAMARLFGEPDWDIRPEEPLAVIWFRAV